jgi:hypothetical protein
MSLRYSDLYGAAALFRLWEGMVRGPMSQGPRRVTLPSLGRQGGLPESLVRILLSSYSKAVYRDLIEPSRLHIS